MDQPISKAQWFLAAAGILMIATAVWIWMDSRARVQSAPPPLSRSAPIALFVQHDGAALRLHWNPDADAVRRASRGSILIGDGPRHSRLELNAADLRSGVASYWPESPRVDFKLVLDGSVAGELQAPALAVREEEPRPSPFEAAPKRKPRPQRVAVEEPDQEMPKPHTVREADRQKEEEPQPEPKKPSRWRRLIHKLRPY